MEGRGIVMCIFANADLTAFAAAAAPLAHVACKDAIADAADALAVLHPAFNAPFTDAIIDDIAPTTAPDPLCIAAVRACVSAVPPARPDCCPCCVIRCTVIPVSSGLKLYAPTAALIPLPSAVPPACPAVVPACVNVATGNTVFASNVYALIAFDRLVVNAVPPVVPAAPSVPDNAAVSTPILDGLNE